MKLIAGIGCAIALASSSQLAAQVAEPSWERLARTRVWIMQRQLRGVGDVMDARARALQNIHNQINNDDRKLAAWREVEDFEGRINMLLEGFARKVQSAIAAGKNDPGSIDEESLASTIRSDRLFEQTILTLIRLSNQQATALAVLPRTGKFGMLQWQIDNTARAAEDWRRQWSNAISDEEDLQSRIAAP